jgi:hypothetical protein
VKSEEFQFCLNGDVLETTLAEAILISPRIHEALRLDRNSRIFTISKNDIDSKSSAIFLEFDRSHDCVAMPKDKMVSLLYN